MSRIRSRKQAGLERLPLSLFDAILKGTGEDATLRVDHVREDGIGEYGFVFNEDGTSMGAAAPSTAPKSAENDSAAKSEILRQRTGQVREVISRSRNHVLITGMVRCSKYISNKNLCADTLYIILCCRKCIHK
jgi:hypothetical protein